MRPGTTTQRRKPGRLITTEHEDDPSTLPMQGATEPVGEPGADDAAEEAYDEPETGPLRRCVVTRARLPRETMLRFVVAPDRMLVPDLAAKLPGRGIWLSASRDVIETARHRGAFMKAARGAVTLPADLQSLVQTGLARRVVELLGLARRAGQAVCGFQKARDWVQAGRAGLLVQAPDGSAVERARLLGGRDLPVITPLPASELGAAFGREHSVHVAVAPGRLAGMLIIEAARLAGVAGLAEQAGGKAGQAAGRMGGVTAQGIGFERAGA